MDLKLRGQRALVTGATSGIGRAIAESLLAEGAAVLINGRDAGKLARVVSELSQIGTVHGIAADIAEGPDAERLAQIALVLGPIEILINNAGRYPETPFFDTSDAQWRDLFELNVMGSVRLARALMPAMLTRRTGRIIFIGSDQSSRPEPGLIAYAMTMAAKVSVARGLAESTKGTAVTVNSVLAGPVWTEGVASYYGASEAAEPNAAAMAHFTSGDGRDSLIQRYAAPSEVADVVTFLCSPRAAAINGAAYRVDGGIIRSML